MYMVFVCVIVEVWEVVVEFFYFFLVNFIEFLDEVVCLLMDMLYDDYMVVRLKVLEVLYYIVYMGNLKI